MKAYIIHIALCGSKPLIWRRVILPAGATYNRLHDTIQSVTNFEGGYPSEGYHLYEFQLTEENRIVTNDDLAYEEHQYYKKNKKEFKQRLKDMPENMVSFEKRYQERLKREVRKPARLKMDAYLEKYQEIDYLYDFGDNWHFKIKLEEIVDDYYFGYPTLLDGAETAPPEDVGGLSGFYDFLKAYENHKHPDHAQLKKWAASTYFHEYNFERINSVLKSLLYKKNEWNKINHDNYKVIEDKYRK